MADRGTVPRSTEGRLRVLLVPDSIHWITGTIARSIVENNDWIDGTIISGAVLDVVARERADIFDSFDLVHFVCPYASKRWLPLLRDRLPCVSSHHHVSDAWELQQHNLNGDAIVVGSSQWAEDAIERGAAPERLVCLPYGVAATTGSRTAARRSLGIDPASTVVGFFAKLSSNEQDRKGTDVFAAAARALSHDLPNLVVLIIGPGWDELVSQLAAINVNCIWLPFVRETERMPQMYHALDFYWVTARVEGGPVTLLEAMSTGLCCVSTPVGLAKQIIVSGENGILVPFNDVGAFAGVTRRYATEPEARAAIGARARESILATMDVAVTTKGVRTAYDIAIAHFEARTNGLHTARNVSGTNGGDAPATSIPEATRQRVAQLEQLAWAEALMLQGQRPLAFRLIAETWLGHPFSTLAPRFLFRNLLPPKLVQAIVRAKVRVSGAS